MSFIDFARAHGVEVDASRLAPSDKIKRCGTTDKPRSSNGAYLWDGRKGWVMNWSTDGVAHWYDDPHAKPWGEEEKQAWIAQRERSRAEEDRRHQRAAKRAAELLRTAVPGRHDYLIRKGLHDAQGLVLPDGDLLVPMRSVHSNELQGAQLIHWNAEDLKWEKKMLPGMKARGAVLRLGPRSATETVFCEGYATGLSIELAVRQMRLNAAVLVCFSDVNMVLVAEQIKRGRRYVFADHDRESKQTGKRAGEEAARRTGLPYCLSPVEGEDANDVHARAGIFAVVSLLMKARQEVAMA